MTPENFSVISELKEYKLLQAAVVDRNAAASRY